VSETSRGKDDFMPEDLQSIEIDNLTTTDILETLPEPILKNIETIALLETEHGRNIPLHQQILEGVAAVCGQPRFLYGQIIFFTIWWICSELVRVGKLNWEVPSFNLHEEGLDVASLLISTGVLIYQTRQDKLAEERSHLTLQLNLLTEQKIAKLIALIEELRIDLPNVRNRQDIEAEEMQKTADPQALLTVLKESLNSTEISKEPQSSENSAHEILGGGNS
jgi:uncharacterized membrane protein